MSAVSNVSRQKSWRTSRERVSVLADLAIRKETVMRRLVKLRDDVGHPTREGEPLPQDQAAQRAGITYRQWQRWEAGESVPFARNLAKIADAFGFEVGEFDDGAGRETAATPSPFPGDLGESQLDRVERRLDALEALLQGALENRSEQGSDIIERLDRLQAHFDEQFTAAVTRAVRDLRAG